jgi:hypothetical protein
VKAALCKKKLKKDQIKVQLARKMFPRRLIVVEDQAIQPAKQAPVCVIEHVLGDYTTSHFEVVSYGNSNFFSSLGTDTGKSCLENLK